MDIRQDEGKLPKGELPGGSERCWFVRCSESHSCFANTDQLMHVLFESRRNRDLSTSRDHCHAVVL